MKMEFRKMILIGILSAILPGICMAEEGKEAGNSLINAIWGPATEQKEWDVTLGAGLRVGQRYEGSDDYVVSPIPFFNVCWRGFVYLGPGGLNVDIVRGQNYQFGAGLTYNPGRDESGSSFFGTSLSGSDERLKGLGDIDPALGVRAFGSYMLGPVELKASITKYTGSQNDGLLLNLGLDLPFHPMNNLTLSPYIGTTWADDNYMQTWFGVTPQQSSRSGLSAFNAESGIKDVTAGLKATYRLNQHWFISTEVGMQHLLGDAGKSPITEVSTGATFGTVVGYHF